uniref:RxLR effector protein n=1 Tax=Phytophthora agathidicida TaxID=1642459 RepID=A0A7G4WHZ2_9STRA|nr:PaRXLR3 [Phytophthora agathidicida]
MRHLSVVVLLAVAVLLVCVDSSTASTVTSATYPTAEQSFDLESGTRLLRRNDDIDEERAGALDKVTELAKAGASKVKEGLAKAHEVGLLQTHLQSADDGMQVLKKLKLGDHIADILANPKLGLLSGFWDANHFLLSKY